MAAEQAPLTPDQRRAAAQLAAGEQMKEIAATLDVTTRTISRWQERDDFRSLVRRLREQMMPETPTAEGTLVAALNATRPDGRPSWSDRIAAAKAILSTPVSGEGAVEAAKRVERIYVGEGEEADVGAPRPFPVEGARDERFQDEDRIREETEAAWEAKEAGAS